MKTKPTPGDRSGARWLPGAMALAATTAPILGCDLAGDDVHALPSLRDAIVAGLNFHIFHKHADRVAMANIAQTVNVLQAVILTDKEKMLLTPTYHVFEMFKVHQGATSLPFRLTPVCE